MNRSTQNLLFKKSVWLMSVLVLLSLVLAACSSSVGASVPTATTAPTAMPQPSATTAPTMAPTQAPTQAPAAEASINIATDPTYGKILVDGKGMTLYMYTKDAPDKSNCAGGCLKAWPPLLTSGSPKLGDGVDASLIGSTALADGTKIVTYNHMPLYYWAKDTKPGDITGLGVGGVWYLVGADGKVVGVEASINIATDPKYGKILVDGKGMTLYMYTKDEPDKSNCTAGCLKAWPPLLTSGNPKLGDGVDASMIGSTALADGTKIVTYNHMPLYYWAKDTKPGDITGLGVGGVWYLVGPDGKVVGKDVVINVVTDPKLGKILVDSKGMTLYAFTKDEANKSNCTGGCLTNWPPLLTSGSPKAGTGADDSHDRHHHPGGRHFDRDL